MRPEGCGLERTSAVFRDCRNAIRPWYDWFFCVRDVNKPEITVENCSAERAFPRGPNLVPQEVLKQLAATRNSDFALRCIALAEGSMPDRIESRTIEHERRIAAHSRPCCNVRNVCAKKHHA